MRHAALIAFLLSIFLGYPVSARNRPHMASSLEDVRERARALEPDSLLELGERNDKSATSLLREIASQEKPPADVLKKHGHPSKAIATRNEKALNAKYARASQRARMALAKMGDETKLKSFVRDLAAADIAIREEAIGALAYVGDKRAIKHLGPLLNDKSVQKYDPPGHELPTPISELTAEALSELLPEVVDDFKKIYPGRRFFHAADWKAWWQKNKGKHQVGIE